jgi:uncharacterized protein (DUF1778 family)
MAVTARLIEKVSELLDKAAFAVCERFALAHHARDDFMATLDEHFSAEQRMLELLLGNRLFIRFG